MKGLHAAVGRSCLQPLPSTHAADSGTEHKEISSYFERQHTPSLKLRSQKHVHYTSHSMARTKLGQLGEITSKSARRICSSVSSTTTDDGKRTQYALTPPSPQQAPGLSRAVSVTMTKSPNSSPMTFGEKEKIRPLLLGVGNARCQLGHMHNSIC